MERHSKDTEGLYLFIEPYYKHFYKELKKIKDKHGFKVMYEIGILKGDEYDRDYIREILDILKPEMASLNHNESCEFFETDDLETIFNNIYDMGFDMFFYRAGKKGSYVLSDHKAYFIPAIDITGKESIDPTGCGNSSTAASMWAWLNTHDPVMTGILANIVGGYNVASAGIIDDLSLETRKEALKLAKKYYDEYLMAHPEYEKERGDRADPDAISKQTETE
ncbi:MAG: carbohydrate kinase family protein [Erysipelotrichaceae bacterium]|nr:carbohydrate kinase family protein [Erysipelotrichaceae bacterium]